jgi:4-amino-4-deoxy-L-arabinose transferase-like glycosyltransferase
MESDQTKRFRSAALALIVSTAGIRLLYLAWYCPLDLAPDEAYYWDWSRHLDWSYHSKGPLVAWLIWLSRGLFGDTMLAVRLPAVVCSSLLLAGLYVLTLKIHQSDKLAFAVVALALTLPIIAAGATLMTIDAPFTCAWMWALVFGYRAVFCQARWAWPVAGVFVLLGLLAKHTMVLWVPSFALFLLTTPTLCPHLKKPGFWILVGIGALGSVPILAWNAMHGWVTLKHTQSHIGLDDNVLIHWLGPLHFLGTQFAVLLGFWFFVWVRAMWHHRPIRETQPNLRFLWWMSAPTFLFFGFFAVKNGGGEANWPLAGYLSGMVLVAGFLAGEWRRPVPWYYQYSMGSTIVFAVLGLLLSVMMHEPIHLQPVLLHLAGPASDQYPMPIRRVDPTSRLRGWRCLAAEVDRVRAELKTRAIEPVLAAERWTQAAELGFYCQGNPAIFCLGGLLRDRDSQYDLWRPNPCADAAVFHRRTFLLVGMDLHRLQPAFESFEPVRAIQYQENGFPVAKWTIVIAHGFRGWGKLEGIKATTE